MHYILTWFQAWTLGSRIQIYFLAWKCLYLTKFVSDAHLQKVSIGLGNGLAPNCCLYVIVGWFSNPVDSRKIKIWWNFVRSFHIGILDYFQNMYARQRTQDPLSCVISYIHGLVQDCSNSSVLAMELLQSCTKPLILHRPALQLYPEVHKILTMLFSTSQNAEHNQDIFFTCRDFMPIFYELIVPVWPVRRSSCGSEEAPCSSPFSILISSLLMGMAGTSPTKICTSNAVQKIQILLIRLKQHDI